jgi:hypothetical protein
MGDDARMRSLAGLNEINYLAVIVAAVVAFGLGALWYAPPVLGKRWMQLTGRTPENATILRWPWAWRSWPP